MSHGTAFRKALGSESLAPNALLGLEYIRAALKYYPDLEYIPIQAYIRSPQSQFQSRVTIRYGIASSSSLLLIPDRCCSTLQSSIPTPILDDKMHRITNDDYVDYNRYYNMVHMLSRQ